MISYLTTTTMNTRQKNNIQTTVGPKHSVQAKTTPYMKSKNHRLKRYEYTNKIV